MSFNPRLCHNATKLLYKECFLIHLQYSKIWFSAPERGKNANENCVCYFPLAFVFFKNGSQDSAHVIVLVFNSIMSHGLHDNLFRTISFVMSDFPLLFCNIIIRTRYLQKRAHVKYICINNNFSVLYSLFFNFSRIRQKAKK